MGRTGDLMEKMKADDFSSGTGRTARLLSQLGSVGTSSGTAPANSGSKAALAELRKTGQTTYAGQTYTAPYKQNKAEREKTDFLSDF